MVFIYMQMNSISLLDKTLAESKKILEKSSEKLGLLVCSGFVIQNGASPQHKMPSSDAHALSNGAVSSEKATMVSRSQSMKKDTQHFDAHNSQLQGHLLNGN